MLASSPIPKQTVGRTFFIAIVAIGVVALVQIGAVCWAFIARFHSSPLENRVALRAAPASMAESQPAKFTDPFAQENSSGAVSVPKPTPIPEQDLVTPPSQAQARLNELLELASTLSDRGDMSTALIRLREAQALAPDDPKVLSGLGLAYEKMGSPDKATEYWEHIYNLGKSAGSYYDMAVTKLNPSPSTPGDEAGSKPDDGFPAGSVLALVGITREDSPDSPGKEFKMKFPVKSRPGAQIDVNDVVVVVLFYEQLDDQSIVETNANVKNDWITRPVDWSNNDIQVLQVEYSAASLDTKIKHPDNRAYYGYIVRVYYKGSLQDARGEPVTLLKQFPPPLTLQNEDAQ